MSDHPPPSPAPEKPPRKSRAKPLVLQPGDVVYLKSGSSAMTVEKIEGEEVHVAWSHWGTKQIIRDKFAPVMLKKASAR